MGGGRQAGRPPPQEPGARRGPGGDARSGDAARPARAGRGGAPHLAGTRELAGSARRPVAADRSGARRLGQRGHQAERRAAAARPRRCRRSPRSWSATTTTTTWTRRRCARSARRSWSAWRTPGSSAVACRSTELGWWDAADVGGVRVTYVPSQHWSRRGLTDANRALWGGFVIESGGLSIYHSGDTAYFEGFAEIGRRFPRLDVALLPIGAYDPQWFMSKQHMNPDDALARLPGSRRPQGGGDALGDLQADRRAARRAARAVPRGGGRARPHRGGRPRRRRRRDDRPAGSTGREPPPSRCPSAGLQETFARHTRNFWAGRNRRLVPRHFLGIFGRYDGAQVLQAARACSCVALMLVRSRCLSALAPVAAAADLPPEPAIPATLTLGQAVALFRAHGLDLLIAEAAAEGAAGDALAAGAIQNPSVTGGYYHSFFQDDAFESHNGWFVGLGDSNAIVDTLSGKRGPAPERGRRGAGGGAARPGRRAADARAAGQADLLPGGRRRRGAGARARDRGVDDAHLRPEPDPLQERRHLGGRPVAHRDGQAGGGADGRRRHAGAADRQGAAGVSPRAAARLQRLRHRRRPAPLRDAAGAAEHQRRGAGRAGDARRAPICGRRRASGRAPRSRSRSPSASASPTSASACSTPSRDRQLPPIANGHLAADAGDLADRNAAALLPAAGRDQEGGGRRADAGRAGGEAARAGGGRRGERLRRLPDGAAAGSADGRTSARSGAAARASWSSFSTRKGPLRCWSTWTRNGRTSPSRASTSRT